MSQKTSKKLTKEIKKFALSQGADMIGIGSMDRFEGAPKQMDPRYIFPEARVIIGLGFSLPRGFFPRDRRRNSFWALFVNGIRWNKYYICAHNPACDEL
jgi:epoxyqueuosine reductase QueG